MGIIFNSSTPKKISNRIVKFLKTMHIHSSPIYLEFTFIDDKYLPKYCLSNCECESKKNKGQIVYGWTIWEDKKNRFIEAEFHSVIKRNSKLIDITPRVDGEEKILFAQDETRVAKREDDFTWCTWSNQKLYNGKITETIAIKLQDVKSNVWESHNKAMDIRL